jgi:hypothetical protein
VICSQGFLPLTFDEPTCNCRQQLSVPWTGALTGYCQQGQLSPGFLTRLLLLTLTLFQPGLGQNQKTHVPGFSPKYFTIWGRNMVTKHTTGEQITGN